MKIRVGFGFDVHKLVTGRELWLGGIRLEHEMGLLGHSDADVLIHAICDALLGAANMRDIGYHFPDNSADFKNIDSKILLAKTVKLIAEKGYRVGNVDATVCAERPKLKKFIPEMQEVLARVMEVDVDDVSIKATTTEKLGFTGREEGISAYATVLIEKDYRRKKMNPKYSVVIPVYNRPDEVDELLQSLCGQTYQNFEVVVVEDGSAIPCKQVVEKYAEMLDVHYFEKPNSGPGQTRNYAAERSRGKYLLILDSDCILPETYLAAVEAELQREPADAFGGPDRAHDSFSDVQKAINYAMTSFFTTGGIRGGKKKMDKFYPRSFNMGVRAEVYKALGGFSAMRFGEDIDFSIRIFKGGYRCRLFPEAWVWHKRRTDLKKFFKQVHNSGIARIDLYKKYPESLKLVHLLPAVFTVGVVLVLLAAFICPWSLLLLALFAVIIFIDASIRNKSIKIGALSVIAAFIQLTGYGSGFLRAWWKRCICGGKSFSAFEKTFYK